MNASAAVRAHPRRRWLQRQYEVRTFEESGAYWARRYPMNEPTAAVRKAMRNVLPVAAPTWMPLTLKAKRPARRIWHSPAASPTMTDPTAPPRRKRVSSRRADRYAPAAVPTRSATPTSVNGEWMVAGWCLRFRDGSPTVGTELRPRFHGVPAMNAWHGWCPFGSARRSSIHRWVLMCLRRIDFTVEAVRMLNVFGWSRFRHSAGRGHGVHWKGCSSYGECTHTHSCRGKSVAVSPKEVGDVCA